MVWIFVFFYALLWGGGNGYVTYLLTQCKEIFWKTSDIDLFYKKIRNIYEIFLVLKNAGILLSFLACTSLIPNNLTFGAFQDWDLSVRRSPLWARWSCTDCFLYRNLHRVASLGRYQKTIYGMCSGITSMTIGFTTEICILYISKSLVFLNMMK